MQPATATLIHPLLTGLALGIGVAVAVLATVLIIRRTQALRRRWAGGDAPGRLVRAGAAARRLAASLLSHLTTIAAALRTKLAAFVTTLRGG